MKLSYESPLIFISHHQVLQVAVITPPYEPQSVQCTNEVVLDKVMKLVQQMPIPGHATNGDATAA